MKDQLVNWLRSQQEILDGIITQSAIDFTNDFVGRGSHIREIFKYDHSICENESFNLVNGGDLSYDRPTIGLTYAGWYLARRINTSLNLVIDGFIDRVQRKENIYIFDIGAGTGSVSIALQLCMYGALSLGYNIPKCHIINVDISPFMLSYHKDYLWRLMIKHYPISSELTNTYAVNSWVSEEQFQIFNPWIIASYLFDHSEHHDEIKKVFIRYIEEYKPSLVSLITSIQRNKKYLLDTASSEIEKLGYSVTIPKDCQIFRGKVKLLDSARKALNQKLGTSFSKNYPTWNEKYGFHAKNHIKNELGIIFPPATRLSPFANQIKVRREIILNKEQREAAVFNGRPKVVKGPAGSGKSVVLTEYVKNIVEKVNYNHSQQILVTTFNKKLMKYLRDWVLSLLDINRAHNYRDHIRFINSNKVNIYFWHFDILPTRLYTVSGMAINPIYLKSNILFEDKQIEWLDNLAKECFDKYYKNINPRYKDPFFLKDEYERVIYGQQYLTMSDYQNGVRTRRQFPNIPKQSKEREFIFRVISRYLNALENFEGGYDTFYTRRHKLLSAVRNKKLGPTFDFIIVDEFQDCTLADFQIFYYLIKSTNHLILGGDLAQSINLGSTALIPRADIDHDGERMRNIDHVSLNGSYRLPFMVSKFVKPLSQIINKTQNEDANIIEAYKGSPPGARPILVYAEDTHSMVVKLAWIMEIYKNYSIDKFTILEKDEELKNGLNRWKGGIAETDTILRLKGMEKQFVVYSVRSKISSTEDVNYFLYTIFTRTCSLLVISLFPDFSEHIRATLKELCINKSGSYISWDRETEVFISEI